MASHSVLVAGQVSPKLASPEPLLPFPEFDDVHEEQGSISENRGVTNSRKVRLYLVYMGDTIQYILPLIYKNIDIREVTNISSFVSRARLGLMRRDFWSIIVSSPKLHRLAIELQRMGRPFLGDVLQMTRQELIEDADATKAELAVLERLLAEADLSLGIRIADWQHLRTGSRRER